MSLRAHLYSPRSRFATTGPIGVGAISFGGLMIIGAVVTIGVCGCTPEASTSSTNSTGKAATRPDPSATDTRCQQLLSSALDMTKPENLGISTREQQVVDSLNNWAGDCGKAADNDPAPSKAAPSKEGTNEFADRYDQGDVLHIRDCWLTRQLGSGVMREQTNDLDRVVGLFELSIRTVALQGSEESTIPQNRFDIMLVGRGTPEDRAWLFGELLRQAGFDAVIVRPKSSGAPSSAAPAPRWLVGVLLDKDVYLFDPTLGWPIPSLEDKGTTAFVRQPATLAQAAAHDELLRKLDLPQNKYPLRAEDLKSVKAEAISSSRYSEPRFKRLEPFFSGNRSAVVYAALKDAGGRPGLLSRVAAAGNGSWKKEDVSLWDYPDHQTDAARHLDPQAQKTHDSRWLAFQGPVELDFDTKSMRWVVSQGSKIIKGKSRSPGSDEDMVARRIDEGSTEVRLDPRKEIKSRIAHLQGDFPTAIRKYLSVQLDELDPEKALPEEFQKQIQDLPPEKRPPGGVATWPVPERELLINFHAADDATFWMGVCQLEQNEKEPAEETFNAYVRKYTSRVRGKWVVQAAYLRSIALAQSNKFALAVQAVNQLVEAVPASDFRRPTFELLETRWRTVRDAAKPVAADSNAESKPQEKPPATAPKTEPPTKTPPNTQPAASDSKPADKPKSP